MSLSLVCGNGVHFYAEPHAEQCACGVARRRVIRDESEWRAFRAGYAMGYADRHDGQTFNPEHRFKQWLK